MTPSRRFPIDLRHLAVAVVAIAFVMKVPFLARTPTDWDEGVYLYLSERMGWLFGDYSLAGSVFEQRLAANVYGSPVFHHPPLVPFLLKVISLFVPTLVAAKILNMVLVLASYFLVYGLAEAFGGRTAALVAIAFWTVCPVFNLESSLVHLDFPMAVFLLGGVRLYLLYAGRRSSRWLLVLSALCFDLAMLTKYTAPLYVLVPLALAFADREMRKDGAAVAMFLLLLLPGFSWWMRILVGFHSLVPAAFSGDRPGADPNPFMAVIAERHWYDMWLYYLGMCPLFLLYLGRVASEALRPASIDGVSVRGGPHASKLRGLAAINLAVLASTLLFCLVNARTNRLWVLRHVFPLFPIVYVTLGCSVARLFREGSGRINAYLLAAVLLNFAFMSFSTMLTMMNLAGVRAIPAVYFWIPGLREFFH